jgi:hypothetical protein
MRASRSGESALLLLDVVDFLVSPFEALELLLAG